MKNKDKKEYKYNPNSGKERFLEFLEEIKDEVILTSINMLIERVEKLEKQVKHLQKKVGNK